MINDPRCLEEIVTGDETWIYHFQPDSKAKNKVWVSSSKLKELEDDNFKFNENGRKVSRLVENTAGKGEMARYVQFLFFPHCFQKTCTADM